MRRHLKTMLYWAGFAGIMLSLAPMSSCPRPTCNGSCPNPADTDDCAMCCGSKEDCHRCCEDAYGDDPNPQHWAKCSDNCDTRWNLVYVPVNPGGPPVPLGQGMP